jgi:uroporphyrinogen decarboxylase
MPLNDQPNPNFERLRKTLYCGQADRVPLAEITIDEGAKEAFLGKSLNTLSTDIEFYIQAGYDYITLGRRIAGFPPVWDSAHWGNYYEVQRQVGRGKSKGAISDWDDFKRYPWLRPDDLDFRILDEAEKILPKEMKVIRYMGPVFQMTWMLMGFETFCYKQADDPALVEAIFEKIFEMVYREFEDAIQRDIVGAVWYGDDIAVKDRLMVSPDFLRKIFFPKLKRLGEGCKKRGIPLIYHTDGDITQVLEDIIASGVNALHPIDPTGMDIYQIKKRVAGRLCIIGNIDVDLLQRGTAQEVEEDTKKHLKLLGPGGGYVLGSSNSIPRTSNPENYRKMLETALKYGTYPINIK